MEQLSPWHHNCSAWALEPGSHNYLSPRSPEPVLQNRRSHGKQKPARLRVAPTLYNMRKALQQRPSTVNKFFIKTGLQSPKVPRQWKVKKNPRMFQTKGDWRDMTTKGNRWFWTGSFWDKGSYRVSCQNLSGVWGFHGGDVSMFISCLWWLSCGYSGECLCYLGILEYLGSDRTSCRQLILKWRKEKKCFIPEYSLEGLVLKLQYFGNLMGRANSKEKMGKMEGRRRGWQRTRWLDAIIDSMDTSLSKIRETVKDGEAWSAAVHGFEKSWTWLTEEQCTRIFFKLKVLE